MRVNWEQVEDIFLRDNYSILSRVKISKHLGRTISSCVNRAKKIGVLRKDKFKYHHNKKSFSNFELNSCYWAGLLAADGCLRTRGRSKYVCLSLKHEDRNHVEKLADFLQYDGPIKKRKSHGFPNAVLELCGCEDVFNDLVSNFNVTPRKSLTLEPPIWLNGDERLAFIAGLLDGDGTIRQDKKGRLEISCVGTFDELNWMKLVFDEVVPPQGRYNPKVRPRRDRGSKYAAFKITGFRAAKIASMVLALGLPLLPRKWNKIETPYVAKGGSAFVWAKRFAA